MEEILCFAPSAHMTVVAVEYIIYFTRPVLIKFAFKAGVLAECYLALWIRTFEARFLDFSTVEASNVSNLLEGHSLDVAGVGLRTCILFVMAELACIVNFTARGLNFTVSQVMITSKCFLLLFGLVQNFLLLLFRLHFHRRLFVALRWLLSFLKWLPFLLLIACI